MPGLKLFSLEEAERTLPLVRRIVADLMEEHPRWRAAVGRFELASSGARGDAEPPPELAEAQAEVAARATRIAGYLQELEAIGCVFKGFDAGLVDFYSLRYDEPVFLCWCHGEPGIAHWHPLDGGFAGRRPIDEGFFTETSG